MERSVEERYAFSKAKATEVKVERERRGITANPHSREQYDRERTCLALSTVMKERYECSLGGFLWITLTYFDHTHWAKSQISTFIRKIRRAMRETKDNESMIFWCLEGGMKSDRMNTHYHIIVHYSEGANVIGSKWVKENWAFGQQIKCTQIVCEEACKKVAKYMAKKDRKSTAFPPKTHRLSNSGLNEKEKARLEWLRAPEWVRRVFREDEWPMPYSKGGGYYSKVTREHVPSPCYYHSKIGDFHFKTTKQLGPAWQRPDRKVHLDEMKMEDQVRREERKERHRKRVEMEQKADAADVRERESERRQVLAGALTKKGDNFPNRPPKPVCRTRQALVLPPEDQPTSLRVRSVTHRGSYADPSLPPDPVSHQS